MRILFYCNGIIAQLFGTNEKTIYRYKTNKMCNICKFDTQCKKAIINVTVIKLSPLKPLKLRGLSLWALQVSQANVCVFTLIFFQILP